jgi:2'-5' RNA ligase
VTYRDIGVAIGIPEPFSTELQTWRERLGDPNASRIPPHVTLLAPTALRNADLGRVEQHLQAIALGESPFRIHLRSSGTFRPVSPVVFVNLVEGISQCELLQERVRTGPLNRPLRFPYHPHVTVAHDLDDDSLDRAFDSLADFDAVFDVWAFTLFERGRDGAWRPQRDFPLGCGRVGPQPAAEMARCSR